QQYDVLIFNQQVTGSISNDSFIQQANELFTRYAEKIVILDSRHFNHRFKHTYLKANDREVASLVEHSVDYNEVIPLSSIKEYGTQIFNTSQKPLFITCGERGIVAIDSDGSSHFPGLQLKGKLDTVGA